MKDQIRDPRDVIRGLFALEEKLSAAPSVQGALEDQLKQGTRVQTSIDLTRAQAKHHALAEAVFKTADLSAEELEVCRARYHPDARETGVETYERVVRDCDAPTATSGQGEEILGAARDPSGERIEGHARVRGRRARMPTYQEIGEVVGLTARQVDSRLRSALRKVRQKLGADVLEELGKNMPEGS